MILRSAFYYCPSVTPKKVKVKSESKCCLEKMGSIFHITILLVYFILKMLDIAWFSIFWMFLYPFLPKKGQYERYLIIYMSGKRWYLYWRETPFYSILWPLIVVYTIILVTLLIILKNKASIIILIVMNERTAPSFLVNCQSDQISRSVVSDSLQRHESQHARTPCPSPTPGVHPNSRPSSQWCHPAISSSGVLFSSCPNPSQHQSLFQWVNSLHEVAKVLEFQL